MFASKIEPSSVNIEPYIQKLGDIFKENNVCNSHGVEHAIAVKNHAIKAIEADPSIDRTAVFIDRHLYSHIAFF